MSAMDFFHQIRLGSYQLALPVPGILKLCNYLQNVVAITYIFALQLSTFLFYNKHTKKRYNPRIEIEGILFTKDPYWYNSSKEYKKAVSEAYGKHIKIFEQSIPRSNPIAKCPKDGVSIFAYDKNNPGALGYDWLAKEVIKNG